MPRKSKMAPTTKENGRPCKLNPETQTKILNSISRGATYELASNGACIHYDTFKLWMRTGEDDIKNEKESKFSIFFTEVRRIESEHAARMVAYVEAAVDKDWKAGGWIAERRHARHYGKEAGEVREMKEMLAQFIAGQNPELEQMKLELEKLKEENERLKSLPVS